MAAYVQPNNSSRGVVGILIILVHVVVVWALATGLAQKMVDKVAENITADIVEEELKDEKPPPPPPPEMERPPVEVPPPEVSIDMPMETTNSTALTDVTDKPQPPAPAVADRKPVSVAGRPDMKRMPSSEDYYPASSKRNEEQGSATVRVCVDGKGKLTREPVVQASSGFPRLDEGGVKLAKAGRYVGGTIDGQPDPESCFAFKVKFEIK